MSSPISGVGTNPSIQALSSMPVRLPGSEESAVGSSFTQLLSDAMGRAAELEQSAHASIEEYVSGGDIAMSEVLSKVKQNDLSMRLMLQIRNKLMESYEEIKNLRM